MTWLAAHTDTVISALPAGSWKRGECFAPVPVAFTVVPSMVTVGAPPTEPEPGAAPPDAWPLTAGADETWSGGALPVKPGGALGWQATTTTTTPTQAAKRTADRT